MTGRAGVDEHAEKVQRIRHTVEYEKRELENRPGWKCNVPSALYVEDCEWLLAELASLKDALGMCARELDHARAVIGGWASSPSREDGTDDVMAEFIEQAAASRVSLGETE